MKTITQLSLSLAIAIILASCNGTSIDKKSQLEELKKKQKVFLIKNMLVFIKSIKSL